MKNTIIYFLLMVPMSFVLGQDTLITEGDTIITNTGNIQVNQVEVIKAFEAKLMDAKRITMSPTIAPIVPVEKSYDYAITIVPIDLIYPDPSIKPLAMNPDDPKPVKHFYSRLGYGNLKSPYADISFHGKKGDQFDYTLSGHYYGADDSEEILYRKFYESELRLDGGYRIGENNKLTVDLLGGLDQRNRYDTIFTQKEDVTADQVERKILKLAGRVGFSNIETTGANIDYGIGIRGQFIDIDNAQAYSEYGLGLDLNIQRKFGSKFALFLEADGQIHGIDYPGDGSSKRNAFIANPGLSFSIGNFKLKAAADILIDDNGSHPFIDADISLGLLENSIQAFIGTDQVVKANTLWNHYELNPFTTGFIKIPTNTLSKQFYGGIRGNLRQFLSFDFMAGYEDVKNQAYYENFAGFLMFVRFEDMTNFFINASIDFQLNDNVSLGAVVSQNFYSPAVQNIFPNTPEYNYTIFSKISLLDNRLKFNANFNLEDKIIYLNDIKEEVLGNDRIDLSLGFDLFITKNIGIWAKGNNLLDRSYLRYENMPEFGRNFLGGIIVTF